MFNKSICIKCSIVFMLLGVVSCESKVKEYYPTGELKLECDKLKDGQFHGEVKKYYPSGIIESISYFDRDELNGRKTVFYENGIKHWEADYKNGLEYGIHNEYSHQGVLQVSSEMKNDMQHGMTRSYYENGQLRNEMKYKNGVSDGQYVSYYEDGNKSMHALQRYGETVYYTEYSPNGEIAKEYQKVSILLNKVTVGFGSELNAEIVIYGPELKTKEAKWWFSKKWSGRPDQKLQNEFDFQDNYYAFNFTPLDTGSYFLFSEFAIEDKKIIKSAYSKFYVKSK